MPGMGSMAGSITTAGFFTDSQDAAFIATAVRSLAWKSLYLSMGGNAYFAVFFRRSRQGLVGIRVISAARNGRSRTLPNFLF